MTLEQLQARLALYLEAEATILRSQEYTLQVEGSSRRFRRADLSEVRDEIRKLNAEIAIAAPAAGGGPRRRLLYINPCR